MNKSMNGTNILKVYKKVDSIVLDLEKSFVGIMLIIISILSFVNVISRYFFGNSLNWVGELSQHALVWITFIGGSLCARYGEHVVMDMVQNRFPKKMYRYSILVIGVICTVTSFYLLCLGVIFVNDIIQSGEFNPILNISSAWLYLSVPVGLTLMTKNFIEFTIKNFLKVGEQK